jgi:hypothetical protein
MINADINILESDAQISKNILNALLPQVDKLLKNSFNKCEKIIPDLVISAIKSSRTYDSLTSGGGKLRLDFGLPNSKSSVDSILAVLNNIKLDYTKPSIKGNQISGGFALSMIKADYSDIIGLPAAKVQTEKGEVLDWLQWLLLFGDKTIIKDYEVKIGNNQRSRTGGAVMVKGGRWGVPSEFAGTIKKNWITEAIDSIEDQVQNLLSKSLRS